jgi:succinate dehydrogenase / fumarate reductase iron-sulfur subunit
MINQMDVEGFGGCTQIGECAAVCPKGIGLDVISRYHREVLAAVLHRRA